MRSCAHPARLTLIRLSTWGGVKLKLQDWAGKPWDRGQRRSVGCGSTDRCPQEQRGPAKHPWLPPPVRGGRPTHWFLDKITSLRTNVP